MRWLKTLRARSQRRSPRDFLLEHGPIIGELEGRLTVRAIKINFDGALGSRGTARLGCAGSTGPNVEDKYRALVLLAGLSPRRAAESLAVIRAFEAPDSVSRLMALIGSG